VQGSEDELTKTSGPEAVASSINGGLKKRYYSPGIGGIVQPKIVSSGHFRMIDEGQLATT